MKSIAFWTCLIAMLLMSTVSVGEIQSITSGSHEGNGWGDYESSFAHVEADDEDTTKDGYGYGLWKLKTTEAGWFDTYYYIEVYAYSSVDLNVYGPCNSDAWAWGWTSDGFFDFAFADSDQDDVPSPPGEDYEMHDPDASYNFDYEYLEAMDYIEAEHEVDVEGRATSLYDNSVTATARAEASIDME